MEDTMTVEKTFDRVSALLLTIDVVKKKLWLKLTGPDNGRFKLTKGKIWNASRFCVSSLRRIINEEFDVYSKLCLELFSV